MNHLYRVINSDELEVRNKKRVILGYIHTRCMIANGRSSVMRIQPLSGDILPEAYHNRKDARKALEALHESSI